VKWTKKGIQSSFGFDFLNSVKASIRTDPQKGMSMVISTKEQESELSIAEQKERRKVRYDRFVPNEIRLAEVLRAHGLDAQHVDETRGAPSCDIRIASGCYSYDLEVKTRANREFDDEKLRGLWPFLVMEESKLADPRPHFVACVSHPVFNRESDPIKRAGFFFLEANDLYLAEGWYPNEPKWWKIKQEHAFGIEGLKARIR